ncbi:hypothetical protein KKG56_08600, partial [bacterium]|nr:hypothetical protein [bacterium]
KNHAKSFRTVLNSTPIYWNGLRNSQTIQPLQRFKRRDTMLHSQMMETAEAVIIFTLSPSPP